MGIFIGLLTFVLVVDCLFLILLILVQLPKKEAGVGQAFGGGATDALFGAGSGTALTKLTKYATGIFLGMTLLLTVLNANQAKESSRSFEEQLKRAAQTLPPPVAPTNAAAPGAQAPAIATTNLPLTSSTSQPARASNLLLSPASNAPAATPGGASTNTAPPAK